MSKHLKVFLPNGFVFKGTLIEEDEQTLTLIDSKTGNQRTFNKTHVESWELII